MIQLQLDVSADTVLRWVKKKGIFHSKALRRPLLTPIVAQKRLEFALKYYHELPSFWHRWIFTDESTVARGQGERGEWVFCRQGRYFCPLFSTTY
jgi:hypothetical protein